jgi:hypothetical protein
MATSTHLHGPAPPATAPAQLRGALSAPDSGRPAAAAADRVFGVSLLLGLLGLTSAAFVTTRLFESWRVTSASASHRISVLGQSVSYPAANAEAIAVSAFAILGLAVAVAAVRGVARELLAERRFSRAIAARSPRPLRDAWVIEDSRPCAFCAGLLRPRVYLSTATVEILDASALEAVLAHERHHAECRDPLRLASGRVVVAALFFLPPLRRLLERQQALAELGADEAALLAAGGDRAPLASAMLGLSDASASVDPDRIDHLLGELRRWRFPLALCLALGAAIALFSAVAALAASAASGSATLAPPFLSSQPCVAVLALLPAAFGWLGARRLHASRAASVGRRARASA